MRRRITATGIIRNRYIISEADLIKSIRESVRGGVHQVEKRGSNNNVTVICDPNFVHELLSYFHWTEKNAQNYLEDTFRISGQVFYDEDRLILVPRFLLRMVSSNRTKTSVVTTVENKQGAVYQNYVLEQSLSQTDYSWLKEFGPLEVLGHGHSHPDLGGIGVNPSSIDVNDHRRNLQDHALWLSHIVDPIRGLSGFYFGPELSRPKVIYMFYSEDRDMFEKNKRMFGRTAPLTKPKHEHKVIPFVNEKTADTMKMEEREESDEVLIAKEKENLEDLPGKQDETPCEETIEPAEDAAVPGQENIENEVCDPCIEEQTEKAETPLRRFLKRIERIYCRLKRVFTRRKKHTKKQKEPSDAFQYKK